MKTVGKKQLIEDNTEAEFIAEHYWGYSKQRDNSTVGYEVKHPRWNIWRVSDSKINIDIENLYGKGFVEPLSSSPASAFLADGSKVEVLTAKKI